MMKTFAGIFAKTFAMASVLLVASALTASASTLYIFKDVGSPPGHARSQATKVADGHVCGASASDEISAARGPAFVKCMSSHGWAIARIVPDRSAQTRQAYGQPNVTQSNDDDWLTQNENDTSAEQRQWEQQQTAASDDEQNAIDSANAGYAQAAAQAASDATQAASFAAQMTVGN